MSHTWMRHVKRVSESCYTYECEFSASCVFDKWKHHMVHTHFKNVWNVSKVMVT